MSQPYPIALVTGAARRIGAAIAERLHRQGFDLILHYHTAESEALALADTLNRKRPFSCHLVQADLADIDDSCEKIYRQVKQLGHLKLLVHNASEFFSTPVAQATQADWERLINVNAKIGYFLVQKLNQFLKEEEGNVVFISDIYAKRPLKNYSLYSISKAALEMTALSLARELAPYVRVNAVAPSAIVWPEGDNALEDMQQKKILARIPLKRQGQPRDIAEAVLFLACQNYMTGVVLPVDGGRRLD